MGESFELPAADAVTFGTVGEPGNRIFFVQAWAGPTVMTLKAEKQQVAGLAAALQQLLADLPPESSPLPAPGLRPPLEPAWAIGGIGLSAYEADTQRVTLLFEELVPGETGEEAATAVVGVTVGQMIALVERGEELVAGGRPNCPLCGTPMDPDGHSCPKTNGHLKH